MMSIQSFVLVTAAAAGGVLDVTWQDCGDSSTHGRITDLQPTQITIGQDGTLTGKGTIDEELTGGTFSMKVVASFGIKETYSGNACEAKTFNLPLGLGTVSWGGMDCPVAAGPVTSTIGFTLSSLVPPGLATADATLTALDSNGESALCVTTHMQRAPDAVPIWAAAGGVLDVTWQDCGDSSTHGRITDLQPTQITIGQDGTLTGKGDIDEELTGGTFSMKVVASFGIKETYSGNACEAKTFNLPLGLGTVSWGGMDCPVAAGPVTSTIGFTLSSLVPPGLATADATLTALDSNGESALCVTTHMQRASNAVSI